MRSSEAFVLYQRLGKGRTPVLGQETPKLIGTKPNERSAALSHSQVSQRGWDLVSCGLQRFYGRSFDPSQVRTGSHGKPYFAQGTDLPHFNISHSGSFVVAILAQVPVGIDIQVMRDLDYGSLGRRILSEAEYRDLLASDDPKETFFKYWVLKESYVKWTGEGISRSLRDLPMDGWSRFLDFDQHCVCAVRAGQALNLRIEEIDCDE